MYSVLAEKHNVTLREEEIESAQGNALPDYCFRLNYISKLSSVFIFTYSEINIEPVVLGMRTACSL